MLFRKVAAELFDGADGEGISDGIERGDGGGMIATFDGSTVRSAPELLVIDGLHPFGWL